MTERRFPPFAAALGFLVLFSIVFLLLYSMLGDATFIICNLLPLAFAMLYGMRWGLGYAVLHAAHGIVLASFVSLPFDRFLSHGIPATVITIILSGAVGRIRDLKTSLQHELGERRRYERELQEHKNQLESLVAARTEELTTSNERLRREIEVREKAEEEKRRLEKSLKRAEKMEAIGLLAGSVAHDLNNILGALVGYPELLLLGLPGDSPLQEAVHSIKESGERAAAVVQDLLTMARRGVTTAKVINLNEVVLTLLRSAECLSLRAAYPEVEIATELDSGLLNTRGSTVHLSKALLNLVLNAMEALEGGGRVVISTSNTYVDSPSGGYEVLAEGEYVALSVEDTGVGIAPEDLDRIFEPFYTKKVMGRSGTGLGMAIAWGTVKDHSGFIDVHSELGKGTTFTLFLPATRDEPEAQQASARLEEYLGRGETVLIVDDVEMQRELCAALLTRLGYSVSTVRSGEEAIEHLREHPADLLVLDMIMEPGISGLETYQRVIEERPGQRAVIASGFSEDEQVKQTQALGAGAYIQKPYTIERLAKTVRNELRRKV